VRNTEVVIDGMLQGLYCFGLTGKFNLIMDERKIKRAASLIRDEIAPKIKKGYLEEGPKYGGGVHMIYVTPADIFEKKPQLESLLTSAGLTEKVRVINDSELKIFIWNMDPLVAGHVPKEVMRNMVEDLISMNNWENSTSALTRIVSNIHSMPAPDLGKALCTILANLTGATAADSIDYMGYVSHASMIRADILEKTDPDIKTTEQFWEKYSDVKSHPAHLDSLIIKFESKEDEKPTMVSYLINNFNVDADIHEYSEKAEGHVRSGDLGNFWKLYKMNL